MFLSALLVDVADWRWLFVLPVALGAVALAMTLKSVPDSRERSAHSFDTIGALLSVIAVTGLIFVLQEGPERGWTALITLVGLAVGVAASLAFVAWELRRRDASLLDVRLFRERGLAGGSITLLVVFGVQAGISVVLFPFFQAVLGMSGLLSTVALMPMAVMMMTGSGLAPKVAAGIGARSTMMAGVALSALGLALMALFVSVAGGYLSILAGMIVMGAGMGLSMTPSTQAITGSLPRAKQGVASALNDVTREFGTALGIAMLGALLAGGYRSAIDGRLDGVPDGAADTAREGIANAIEVAPTTGGQAQDLVHAARQSFVDGWQQSMWVGAAVMAALLVYLGLRGPKNTAPLRPDAEAAPETGVTDNVAAR
jgi:predicted MFS family arabinose efflux permease